MRPIDRFLRKPKSFWACVRSLSQQIGYSKKDIIIIPTIEQMASAFFDLGLDPTKIVKNGLASSLAIDLSDYFTSRSQALIKVAKPNLMSAEEAKIAFNTKYKELNPKCPIPLNKQKGEKKAEAFLTCLVNMMIESSCSGMECNYDPRALTTFTQNGEPVRTLARRVDGAFPTIVNPIAIWEIKEYYYTTTFGSRVADGVYETLLDGMELEELNLNEGIKVKHYLMVDAYYTWWDCGKAYLCRMFDMLHMGYVDEILFGREIITEIPRIVGEWVKLAEIKNNDAAHP
jgi:hypothetical protein